MYCVNHPTRHLVSVFAPPAEALQLLPELAVGRTLFLPYEFLVECRVLVEERGDPSDRLGRLKPGSSTSVAGVTVYRQADGKYRVGDQRDLGVSAAVRAAEQEGGHEHHDQSHDQHQERSKEKKGKPAPGREGRDEDEGESDSRGSLAKRVVGATAGAAGSVLDMIFTAADVAHQAADQAASKLR